MTTGAAADAGATAPLWLAILLAIIAIVGPVITGVLTYRAAIRATQATAQNNQATNILASSKSNRDLMLQALELCRSDDPPTKAQGEAILDGIAGMPGLSPDDALLVQRLTRPAIERTLSEGRKAEEVDEPYRFLRLFRRPTTEEDSK